MPIVTLFWQKNHESERLPQNLLELNQRNIQTCALGVEIQALSKNSQVDATKPAKK